MKKQIKVTVNEDLYNLLCKNSIKELGEINLSLFTKILLTFYETIFINSFNIKGRLKAINTYLIKNNEIN